MLQLVGQTALGSNGGKKATSGAKTSSSARSVVVERGCGARRPRARLGRVIAKRPWPHAGDNANGRQREVTMRTLVVCGVSVLALCGVATLTLAQQLQQSPYAPKVGDPPEVSNMRLVGYSDLQARSSYQPTIHKQGNRYIAYVGHHGGTAEQPKVFNPLTRAEEFNGTSIIDVTDPANPKYLKHLPGAAGGA